MSNKNKWEALSMKDRAFLMREGIRNGITDLNEIRDLYNQSHQFSGENNIKNNTSRYDKHMKLYREALHDYHKNRSNYGMYSDVHTEMGAKDYITARLREAKYKYENIPILEEEKLQLDNVKVDALKVNNPRMNYMRAREDVKTKNIFKDAYEENGRLYVETTESNIPIDIGPAKRPAPESSKFLENIIKAPGRAWDAIAGLPGWKDVGELFSNAGLHMAMGENPAVMTAMGYVPTHDGKIVYAPSEASNQLARNLAIIGTGGLAMMAAPAVPAFLSNPAVQTAIGKGAESMLYGTLVDEVSKQVTGKTIGENVYNEVSKVLPQKWAENPYVKDIITIGGEMLNPGFDKGHLIKRGFLTAENINNYLNQAKKRTAEAILRIGDGAAQPRRLMRQFLSPTTIKFILNPKYSEGAYKLPYRYSGQVSGPYGAHPNDMIDVFLGKSDILQGATRFPEQDATLAPIYEVVNVNYNDPRVPKAAQKWLKNNNKKTVRLVNFGDIDDPYDLLPAYFKEYKESGKPVLFTSGESLGITSNNHHLVDPGGYNRIMQMSPEGDFKIDNFDIWKFTKEYNSKYLSQKTRSIRDRFLQWARKKGLQFIDNSGTPVITQWGEVLNKRKFPNLNTISKTDLTKFPGLDIISKADLTLTKLSNMENNINSEIVDNFVKTNLRKKIKK